MGKDDLQGQSSTLYWAKVRGREVPMGYTHVVIYKGYEPRELRRMIGVGRLDFYRYDRKGKRIPA